MEYSQTIAMDNCEYQSICRNSDKCYRCFDHALLNIKGYKKKSRISELTNFRDNKAANADDSWKDLEQQVANSLNRIPTIEEARRSRASGALWFETGDIVDSILHPECKERKGTDLKGGDKSISIKKEWLTKAAQECIFENKTMCLPFRFKGDDQIYTIFRHEDISSLITTMKAYMIDNERLRKENERLRNNR